MRWLVTAGGTRESIDAVRVIANASTGRLGAEIADAARVAGHEVLLVHARGAESPATDVTCVPFVTSDDLSRAMAEHVPAADVVVHAAAVADYVPSPVAGKLPSDEGELVLRLRRAPKLIDRLRDQCPDGFLVGFKLTAGADEDARREAALEQLERARLDAVVANDAEHVGVDDHEAVVLGPGGVVLARGRGKHAVARALVALAEARARAVP